MLSCAAFFVAVGGGKGKVRYVDCAVDYVSRAAFLVAPLAGVNISGRVR